MLTITSSNFSSFISEGTSIIYWSAPWCGPCKIISPHLEALSSQYDDKIQFGKLNTDQAPELMRRYGIRGVPTLMIFVNGEEGSTLVGAHTKAQMETFIQKALGSSIGSPTVDKAKAERRSALDAVIPRRGFKR